jgi:thioredoxin 2
MRLGQGPKCGHCHRHLFEGKPVDLNAADFDRHLQRSDLPLLVDFWASWCGPCKMMAPQFEQAAAMLEPEFRLVKVNTEVEQSLATRYGIRSIPTLKLLHNGREVATQAGAMDANAIVQWTRNQLP